MCAKGSRGINLAARTRKKLEQMELMLLTHFPSYRLELHSPSDKVKSHTHTHKNTRRHPLLLSGFNLDWRPARINQSVLSHCRVTPSSSPPCTSLKSGERLFTNSPRTVSSQLQYNCEKAIGRLFNSGRNHKSQPLLWFFFSGLSFGWPINCESNGQTLPFSLTCKPTGDHICSFVAARHRNRPSRPAHPHQCMCETENDPAATATQLKLRYGQPLHQPLALFPSPQESHPVPERESAYFVSAVIF